MAATTAFSDFRRNDFIYYFFYLQVTPMLVEFQFSWPFGSGEEEETNFQDGRHVGHLGFPIGII